ncbi:MAG: HAD-IIA family hydrolase [Acutalibacteraceae bacterium]
MEISKLKNIKLFLFDMDGTLYIGNRLFDFTPGLLKAIRDAGKKYLFITNNSSKSVADYVEKLKRLGIDAAKRDFMTSSQATAYYLKKHYNGKKLYVCGTSSLKEELRQNGFEITENTEETECIVIGYDTELTYRKLEDVCKMLCTQDLPYIATNPDYVCPTEYGSVPDCGSICDMIFNATGKRPIVIGKPSPLMIELAMEKEGCAPKETAVVGDRIYTDIKSGLNAGAVSILVMSGETTAEMLEKSSDKPDIVVKSAKEIFSFLSKGIKDEY